MAKLIGLDIGTSGCKAILVDAEGRVVKEAHAEYPLSTPQPGWSEQDPEDWWRGAQSCLEQLGEKPDAIGLSGQMHGSVFLNAHDEVIRPALLWNDQRTAAECQEIYDRVGANRLHAITCNPPLTGFQLPKLLWLRNHEPENFARLRSLLLPKDYIRFKLTGEKATEPSDAAGTGMLDVPARQWSAEMLQALDLDPALFPKIAESWEVRSGVAGGGGDQAAGAVGTGAVMPGIISVSLGTSGVVFEAQESPTPDPSGATHTFCHANGKWHRMGVMLSCGGALRWYRDTFTPGTNYNDLAEMASRVPPGAEGLTFLPYLAGERCPHNNPSLRGEFIGATLAHTQAHFARAVFEGITFGILDCLKAVTRGRTFSEPQLRLTGGGAKGAFWSQMIADAAQMPCLTLEADEGPAYGAAILAAVGIGLWPTVEEACAATIRVKTRIEPCSVDYREPYARYRELSNEASNRTRSKPSGS